MSYNVFSIKFSELKSDSDVVSFSFNGYTDLNCVPKPPCCAPPPPLPCCVPKPKCDCCAPPPPLPCCVPKPRCNCCAPPPPLPCYVPKPPCCVPKKEYVAGECNFTLVDKSSKLGGDQTWQWEVEIQQNNVKVYLTGTVVTPSGILITPGFLWNEILSCQKKSNASITLDCNSNSNLNEIALVVGTSELPKKGKLYLYVGC